MNVTDEMIEAGLACYSEGGCSGLDQTERREVVAAILSAALSLAPQVKVKPLEWEELDSRYHRADTRIGPYGINIFDVDAGKFEFDGEFYQSLDAAKSAAQADYTARIMSALEGNGHE